MAEVARAPGWLVVFAKAPVPGRVKTRMSPPLSAQQAADLYRCMLEDALETSLEATRALGLEGVVTLDPAEACRELAARVPAGLRVVAQRGVGLGSRMEYEIARGLASGAQRVLLRGSDNPSLEVATIAEVLARLDEVDVAISPDLDGGYGLIGVRRPVPGLFEHPMSTPSVARDTLANARALGLSTATCGASFDLDTVKDLGTLARWRAEASRAQCPRTLAYLDESDLWRLAEARPHSGDGDPTPPRSL